jgi:hypothetical protein
LSLFLVSARGGLPKAEQQRRRREGARAQRSLLLRRQADALAVQFPDLYAKVREQRWRFWYESVTGSPWNIEVECDVALLSELVARAEDAERWRRRARAQRSVLAARLLPQSKGAERRRVLLMVATPRWADRKALASVYAERERMSELTGVLHVVEHTVPLEAPDVCGLHVPWNLRIAPACEKTSNIKTRRAA